MKLNGKRFLLVKYLSWLTLMSYLHILVRQYKYTFKLSLAWELSQTERKKLLICYFISRLISEKETAWSFKTFRPSCVLVFNERVRLKLDNASRTESANFAWRVKGPLIMANNHLESKWNESGVLFQEIHTSYLIRNNVSSKFKLRRRRFAIHLKHRLICFYSHRRREIFCQ